MSLVFRMVIGPRDSGRTADEVSTIANLQLTPLLAEKPLFNVIYALAVLAVCPVGKGPYRIIVTDFTVNFLIHDKFSREKSTSIKSLPYGSLLQLDAYSGEFLILRRQYHVTMGMPLTAEQFIPSANIVDKLCIVRAVVKPKVYNNCLEAKAQLFEVLDRRSRYWKTEPNLKALVQNLARYPELLSLINEYVRKDAIPRFIMKEVFPEESGGYDSFDEFDETQRGEWSVEKSGDSLRGEQLGDLVPGYVFQGDDSEDEDEEEPDEDEEEPDEGQNDSQNESQDQGSDLSLEALLMSGKHPSPKLPLPIPTGQPLGYDFDIVSVNTANKLEHAEHPVRAIFAGTIPRDISHICAKGYNMEGQVKDPHLMPLEILLVDESVDQTEGLFVSQENLIKLSVSPDQLLDLFGVEVERLYTGRYFEGFNSAIGKQVLFEIERQQSLIDSSVTDFWFCTDLELRKLFDQIGVI